jgi:hypothetical protein
MTPTLTALLPLAECANYCDNPCEMLKGGHPEIECGTCPASMTCNFATRSSGAASRAPAERESAGHGYMESAVDAGGPVFLRERGFLTRDSSTAVCLAGEVRTLMAPAVRKALARNLLRPLHADLFLALSPAWHGHVGSLNGGRDDERLTLTEKRLRAIVDDLHPVSTLAARDGEMLPALRRVHGGMGGAALHSVSECVALQPLPAHIELDDRRAGGEGLAWSRTRYQLGPCSPQLSLALRYHACLVMIEHAERDRGRDRGKRAYDWVVRGRPDVGLPCALSLSLFAHDTVLYQDDYL